MGNSSMIYIVYGRCVVVWMTEGDSCVRDTTVGVLNEVMYKEARSLQIHIPLTSTVHVMKNLQLQVFSYREL